MTRDREVCKACGFVREARGDGKPCPACGAKASAFTGYVVRISERRFGLLQAHLHPIMTHFPGSFGLLAVMAFVLSPVVPEIAGIPTGHGGVLGVLVILLPWFAGLTMASGIVDGKARFGRISTPYLAFKIVAGASYLVASILAATLHVLNPGGSDPLLGGLELAMLVASLVLNGALGKVGGRLTCCLVPRSTEAPRE